MASEAGDADTAIPQRLEELEERISAACAGSGRGRQEVDLLLATKTVPAERIRVALAAGYTLIGENRVQEVVSKAKCPGRHPASVSFHWSFAAQQDQPGSSPR
ncbi:MAG: hypothetical protein V9F03_06300 [Microthrixaceae bacterium]